MAASAVLKTKAPPPPTASYDIYMYGNGRSKWWFRSHCTENASDMKKLALESMSGKVIKLAHAMKFARKARDFFRAYRMGACGGEVEKQRRQFAAHRCMLDCYLKFVSEE